MAIWTCPETAGKRNTRRKISTRARRLQVLDVLHEDLLDEGPPGDERHGVGQLAYGQNGLHELRPESYVLIIIRSAHSKQNKLYNPLAS